MARKKNDEAAPEETTEAQSSDEAGQAEAQGETAPGSPSDVIEARQEMQSQDEDAAVDNDDDAAAGNGGDDIDLEAEGEAQYANVTGQATSGRAHIGGPTQDELNPAYSAPTKSADDK